MTDISLEGKRIIVTGASSGIGRAAAAIMGSRGARILLAARGESALEDVASEVSKAGGEGVAFRADMGALEDIEALVAKAKALWGGVDGVFANAGMGGPVAPLSDYALEDYENVMNVNARSIFWLIRLVLPGMVEQRSGSIVATGSIASERGLPMTPAYNMSKHAVLGLVRSAASEVARHNVRVNCLIPGLIHTRMLEDIAGDLSGGDVEKGLQGLSGMPPQRRVGSPGEVGEVAAFLLSDAAAYVNGQAWAVDGGMLGVYGAGA